MKAAIVIASYDGNSDLWTPFFTQFFKYWKTEYKVYLVSNHTKYLDERITMITTGEETSWTSKMKNALKYIDEEIIILFLDDYFIVEPVNVKMVKNYIDTFELKEIDYLRLVNIPKTKIYENNSKIQELDRNKLYGVNLQLAMWNKNYFSKILEIDDSTAWQFEDGQKNRSKTKIDGKIYFSHLNPIVIINGVLQGEWDLKSKKKLIKEGLFLNKNRPTLGKKNYLVQQIKRQLKKIVPINIQLVLKPIFRKLGVKFITKG